MGESTYITHAEPLDETLAELLAEWPDHLREPLQASVRPLEPGETLRDWPFPNHEAWWVYAMLQDVLVQLKLERERRQPKLNGRQKRFFEKVLQLMNEGWKLGDALNKAEEQCHYRPRYGYMLLKRLGIKFRPS